MGRIVTFGKNRKYIRLFCQLPKLLYDKNEIMQEDSCERKLLIGEHPLSRYFDVEGVLVLNDSGEPLARCMLTYYHGSELAYFGFFETIKDERVFKELIEKAKERAALRGASKLIGPMNASFWLGYRLKTNNFEQPYFGEPYNKDYYESYLLDAGFRITDRYYSHHFGVSIKEADSQAFLKRLEEKERLGYRIESPNAKNFEKCLGEIYELISVLYKDFPGFQLIEKEEFLTIYHSMKYIVDYSMIKMAYYQEEAVGFYVSIPNYNNLTAGKITFTKLWKILKIKKKPEEYVMLYLGAAKGHKGLGMALTETVAQELLANKARSIGALIHEGKVTADYYKNLVEHVSEYVLLQIDL